MPQHTSLEILLSAIGIHNLTIWALGHRIDSKIATRKILLQRHFAPGIKSKSLITTPRLTLGSGQSKLFFGYRVQKHWKIGTDRQKTSVLHLVRTSTNYNPVPVTADKSQQSIPDCTTHNVNIQARKQRVIDTDHDPNSCPRIISGAPHRVVA